MLTPVIPKLSDAHDDITYVAQSPDLSGYYPVEFDIDPNLNGLIVYYYGDADDLADNAIQLEANYKNGLLEGEVKVYTNDGNIYCQGQYTKNKKSGTWKFFGTGGIVLETGEYDPKSDSSFKKSDPLIEPFLTPSYFDYGIDTAAQWELKSAQIIPLLNVGYFKNEGRTGAWTFYNEAGKIVLEKTY